MTDYVITGGLQNYEITADGDIVHQCTALPAAMLWLTQVMRQGDRIEWRI